MGAGRCNIGYAAVDRNAEGPLSSHTALRFIAASGWDGVLATRDLDYAELGRLCRQFTNVLRALGVSKGDRVFTLPDRCPELYVTIVGALRNDSIVSPLFSAFGREPVLTVLPITASTLTCASRGKIDGGDSFPGADLLADSDQVIRWRRGTGD